MMVRAIRFGANVKGSAINYYSHVGLYEAHPKKLVPHRFGRPVHQKCISKREGMSQSQNVPREGMSEKVPFPT